MFKKSKKPVWEDTKSNQPKKERKKIVFINLKKFTDKQKFGVFLIIFALVVMFIVQPTANYILTKNEISAVLSINHIEKGEKIEESDIKTVMVSENEILSSMYLSKDDVVGKYALTDILENEVIIKNKISNVLPFDDSYIYTLEDDKMAISITLNSLAASVSSKVQAGDIVSVYSLLNDSTLKSTLFPELAFIRVLDVSDSDGFKANDEQSTLVSTITLEVNHLQSELLLGLEHTSILHLALISRGNEEKSKHFLDKQNKYLLTLEDGGSNVAK